MRTLETSAPDCRLAPFVRCFAQRDTLPGAPPATQALVGSLEHIASFDLGDITVNISPAGEASAAHRIRLVGSQTRFAGSACLNGHVLSFGIFFRPFALWQLFGIPAAELADIDCDAAAVLGPWVTELWHKLACCRNFCERIAVATDALTPFVQAGRPVTAIMRTAGRLLPTDETLRITQVARGLAMSIRSYERQFGCAIGMSPKQFARVARFARAIDLKRRSEDGWLNIAHELGYFDQMHMVRDFRELGGDSPGRLVRADSDFQPWSIAGPAPLGEDVSPAREGGGLRPAGRA